MVLTYKMKGLHNYVVGTFEYGAPARDTYPGIFHFSDEANTASIFHRL